MLAGPAPSSLPFSNSRAFLTSWTIWTDHFGDKDFLFALVLPSVFFFVAIGRSKMVTLTRPHDLFDWYTVCICLTWAGRRFLLNNSGWRS
jgi:hypothetical protein